MGVLEDFEATRQLGERELRELVNDPDPRTRLHAIWALGMRMAPINGYLAGEPDPGVRRALAVVLASGGELDLLVALCRHDPNVHVRASTVQIAMRFAKAGRIPWSIVNERRGDAPEVRAALISQVDAATPEDLREFALGGLEDAEEIVRREAFEVSVALSRAGLADSMRMLAALDRMTTGECKNAVAKWFSIEPAPTIATALVPASRRIREIAIRLRPDLAFTDLFPLVENDLGMYSQVDPQLAKAPLSLMVQAVETSGYRLVQRILTRVAHGTLTPVEVKPHVAMLRAHCAERLDVIEATYGEDDEWGRLDLDEEKQLLESLIAELDVIWSG